MNTSLQGLVEAFHRKYAHPVDEPLPDSYKMNLQAAAHSVQQLALNFRNPELLQDLRYQRATLVLEEVAELLEGMAKGDIVETADAVGDLLYVTLGTAVTFGLPADSLVHEIHGSNMSKDVGEFKPVKGENYYEPDIARVLRR